MGHIAADVTGGCKSSPAHYSRLVFVAFASDCRVLTIPRFCGKLPQGPSRRFNAVQSE
ncbi:hypothetical protein M404DRAFT_1008967 [Pisolithus tinctorius Marx 270]|uniref:Uncharacterized protein n=1 Tax=Pisolithus tinctorius Marx 270 TaxID=870435 RepID=A0A0C3J6U9_PISTI|nr:hypothetical protein M404DRAFT_1008967 [Pisolithus tinctorius Marx 270]